MGWMTGIQFLAVGKGFFLSFDVESLLTLFILCSQQYNVISEDAHVLKLKKCPNYSWR
jgi:hypothetical protein